MTNQWWFDLYDDAPPIRIREGVNQTIPHGAVVVIERSAYDAVVAELEKHRDVAFERDDLRKERDALLAEAEKLVEALEYCADRLNGMRVKAEKTPAGIAQRALEGWSAFKAKVGMGD